MKTSAWQPPHILLTLVLSQLFHSDPSLAGDCQAPSFAATGPFSAGLSPVSVAVGDFDVDGKPDLAVANKFSANVSVLLGNGDGTFQTAVNYGADSGPSAVSIGDFNRDNQLDLAVANSSGNSVSVLLGNGNGTFQTASNYVTGDIPSFVAVGDFNGDAKPDLAVANRATDNVSVLLGIGDGTFLTGTNFDAGIAPLSLSVGDFNGDNKLDLAVANSALFDEPPSVSVLLGNGDGTFQTATNYDAGMSPRSVTVGDFNGDTRADLAVANYGGFESGQFTNSSVAVLLGNGNGTFQPAVNYSAGVGPLSVAVGDLNRDGKADLAVANDRSATVSVLSGNGDGTFQAAVDYTTDAAPFAMAIGDFDVNGLPDLAVVGDHGASLLLNSSADNTPPQMICSANITVNAAPGQCTSNVTFSVTASDNCVVTNVVSVPASGFAFPVGTTPVTSTATDSSGNSSQCTFTVTVQDTQPPLITCPANLTVNAAPGACAADVAFSVTATDNCVVTIVASVPASGFAFPVGTTTVTSTARDSSGNSSQCTFTVTVHDAQPPVLTCPANITVNATPGHCASNVTFSVTATDNCAVTDVVSVPASGFPFPVATTTTVTSTAQDSSGNSSQCTFTVTVLPTPMSIADQPSDVTACNGGTATFTAAATGTLPIAVQWQANTGSGFTNIPSATTTTLSVPANPSTVGSYRAVFRNPCGTNTSASATLALGTSLSCSIDGPSVVCPNSPANTYHAPGFNAYQWSISGDGSLVGPTNSSSVLVSAGPSGLLTLTVRVTDSIGCIGDCSTAVTIQDTEPPVVNCPANLTVNAAPGQCASNVAFSVTATDNCVVTNVLSVPASGSAFPVGTTTVTSTARDSSGNSNQCTFTVTVRDAQPPVVACPANITVNAAPGQCASNVMFSVTATDNCAVTNVVSVPASGFAFPVGTTTVTSTARDSSGNSNQCTFSVTVQDTQPPVIHCPANLTVNAAPGACTSNVTFGVSATDNCAVTNVMSVPASGFAFPVGTTTVTSTALDSSGNTSQCTFTVTVHDTQPPLITCPANITVNAPFGFCTSNVTFSVTATDNCSVTNVVSVPASGFAFPVGTTTVTSMAQDSSGNTRQCTFTVTVNDTQPPLITCPANIAVNATAGQCTSIVTFSVTATDNCAVTNVVSVPASGFAFPVGTTTVTSTATDSSGNTRQCIFSVTVQDTLPPAIDCPASITVDAAPSQCTSNVTFSVTATDDCPVASVVSVPPSGFAFPVGTTTVTSTARDSSGNNSQCTFTVTVVDNQLPVLSGLPSPSLRVQCLADVPSAPTVTANDNCDGNVTVAFSPSESGDPCNRTISRTWSAMDTSSNRATFTQTIRVHDDTDPSLTNGTIATNYATVAEAAAAALAATGASDNCSAVTKTVSTVGNCPVVITVTGIDACGNQESVSYNTCISADIRLAIVRNDTAVIVSWPFPSTGFVLEYTPSLSPSDWQPATEMATVNNGRWEVTVPIDHQERYFRLHKP